MRIRGGGIQCVGSLVYILHNVYANFLYVQVSFENVYTYECVYIMYVLVKQ